MLKRIIFVVVAALLMLGTLGCACSPRTVTPTPSPSMRPVSTPEASLNSPAPSPDAGASPDAAASPGANATIENFSEGTEVKVEEVPNVKTAIETKYTGAVIKTIKHATKDGKQVYEVQYDLNGKTETVYVMPDGTIVTETTTP
jgi:hypothetical protein